MDEYYLLSFDSTHQAIKSETLLKGTDYTFRLIPTPGEITAGCGLTLKTEQDVHDIVAFLKERSITWHGLYQVTSESGTKIYKEIK